MISHRKFMTKSWLEVVNENNNGECDPSSQIKFKTTILKSRFCDYLDTYILLKGTVTITGARSDAAAQRADKRKK